MKKTIFLQNSLLLLATLNILISCATEEPTVPSVSTQAVSNIKATRAKGSGNLFSNGGTAILATGVCWDTSATPTIDDFFTQANSNAGSFSYDMKWLMPNTTYYVRAYATNAYGISYGQAVSFKTDSISAVGDSIQGGIIAYILTSTDAGYDPNVQHGLIVSLQDQSTSATWQNGTDTITGAAGTVFGTGLSNTNSIVSIQGAGNYAAKLCSDLVLNGYNDWYLPSKAELNLIYNNSFEDGGFSRYNYYWTASEVNANEAWAQDFYDGTMLGKAKNNTYSVRAVRNY